MTGPTARAILGIYQWANMRANIKVLKLENYLTILRNNYEKLVDDYDYAYSIIKDLKKPPATLEVVSVKEEFANEIKEIMKEKETM